MAPKNGEVRVTVKVCRIGDTYTLLQIKGKQLAFNTATLPPSIRNLAIGQSSKAVVVMDNGRVNAIKVGNRLAAVRRGY